MLPYFSDEDRALYGMLEHRTLLTPDIDCAALPAYPGQETHTVCLPNEEFLFLHEAAVMPFHGKLYAAWYNNPEIELNGYTPIRGSVSADGGKSWSPIRIVAEDRSGAILYCPPVFAVYGERLYMFLNEMVSADHIHSFDLYVLEEESGGWRLLWRRPVPFKLNTNVVKLPSGKWMLPGRCGELDGFPATPAVLLSDSGTPDGDWRLVKVQSDRFLPDGCEYVHPESSAIVCGDTVTLFVRDDRRRVPLLYESRDGGESWSGPTSHDIPFSSSKIYAGTLRDGRNYVIGNLHPGRTRLAVFFSRPGSTVFDRGYLLQDECNAALGYGVNWHYPCAEEADGKLYIISTVNVDEQNHRGAALTVLPLEQEGTT